MPRRPKVHCLKKGRSLLSLCGMSKITLKPDRFAQIPEADRCKVCYQINSGRPGKGRSRSVDVYQVVRIKNPSEWVVAWLDSLSRDERSTEVAKVLDTFCKNIGEIR